MNISRIFTAQAVLISVLALSQGCQKDESPVFDKSASVRLQESLSNIKATLEGAEYGWRMEYFAATSATDYGGYNFVLTFDSGTVAVGYENNPDTMLTSLYKMTDDNGPVLSFDTYNAFIHYFATPSSAKYEGRGGDFEFTVTSCSDEEIDMVGKRSGKIIKMYPLDTEPQTYIRRIHQAAEDFLVAFCDGTVGTSAVSGSFDLNMRQFTLKSPEGTVTVPFVPTLTGIKLYDTLTIGGHALTGLDFDTETFALSDPQGDPEVQLKGRLPDDYLQFEFFAGDYVLNYWNNSAVANVTLTPDPESRTYKMKGLSAYYELVLNYNRTLGRLEWNSQMLGSESNGNSIWLCAWDSDNGILSRSTEAGMETVWNGDEENPVFTWTVNGYEEFTGTKSFIFWEFDSDGNSVGWYKANGWDPYNRYYFPLLNNLTKK